MKLIEEKTEDYLRENNITQYEYNSFIEGAVFGANYVLDKIENIINSDRILGHPFPSLEMRYDQIRSVIEQLKK